VVKQLPCLLLPRNTEVVLTHPDRLEGRSQTVSLMQIQCEAVVMDRQAAVLWTPQILVLTNLLVLEQDQVAANVIFLPIPPRARFREKVSPPNLQAALLYLGNGQIVEPRRSDLDRQLNKPMDLERHVQQGPQTV